MSFINSVCCSRLFRTPLKLINWLIYDEPMHLHQSARITIWKFKLRKSVRAWGAFLWSIIYLIKCLSRWRFKLNSMIYYPDKRDKNSYRRKKRWFFHKVVHFIPCKFEFITSICIRESNIRKSFCLLKTFFSIFAESSIFFSDLHHVFNILLNKKNHLQ